MLHHHLLPVPGTGRERNIVYDAGDLLEVLLRCRVNLVLCGHKHVPYAWKLEDMFVVTAGTVSSLRLRGHTRPCYNIVEIGPERVAISRKYPFDDREPIVEFSPTSHEYEKSDVLHEGHEDPLVGPSRTGVKVIALIDGEHHPDVVRDALDRLADDHEVSRCPVRGRGGEGSGGCPRGSGPRITAGR